MKETELAEPVVAWLQSQNWTIYQEVQFRQQGGVADIVAVRNGILWIIETKVSLTIEVLNQASAWCAHYRSVAVPMARSNSKRDYRVAKFYYGVGVLEVSGNHVDETLKPPIFLRHHKAAKRMLSQLTDLHKVYAKAGSQSGNHLTPYKDTMMAVRRFISRHPGCTVKELFDNLGSMHYANKISFKGNVLKCLLEFEKSWCRVDCASKPYTLYVLENAPIERPELSWFYK